MDLAYVKKLIRLLSDSNVDELEIEEEGKKVRIVKRSSAALQSPPAVAASPVPHVVTPAQTVVVPSAPAPLPNAGYQEIKSPIVGTFYRAPAPDAAPFIQVGSDIQPGTVLCIVEAMKLMNEIESDISGKIAKILVENGQPVEYDQTLFLVEKS